MKRRGRGSGGQRTRGETLPRPTGHRRSEKSRILVVCEGRLTEPNYFRGLRDEEAVRQRFVIEVRKGKGGSSAAVVEQAIYEQERAAARGMDFDEAWCVLDVEAVALKDRVSEARTLANRHQVQLALSNPSFEVWLLAHFVRTKKSFADCDRVIEELNKHWRRETGREYAKNDEQLYTRVASRTRQAIESARNVRAQDWASSSDIADCNSATEVYVLVERLLGPPQ